MKKIYLLLLLAGCCTSAATAQNYSRVQVGLNGKNIRELARLGVETDHGEYLPGQSFTTDLSKEEIFLVQNAGFQTQILIADVEDWYIRQLAAAQPVDERGDSDDCGTGNIPQIGDYPTPANYTYGSMGGYHTYTQMLAVLEDMQVKFPNLISTKKVLSDSLLTAEGRPLWWVRISDNPENEEAEPKVLYTGLHHAREPNGMSQMLYFMWYLLENYDQKPELQHLLNHVELYFVPCLNPDGYIYNQTTNPNGGGSWRKNRRPNAGGSFGVDLNRNYGFNWGADDDGSSPNPTSGSYRGPAPFSEPETRMLRVFCQQHNFEIALNYHTFGNLLIYPWAYNVTPADPKFVRYGALFSQENKFRVGTVAETVGYPVNGGSDDWMFANEGIYALTPEVGPAIWGFWPPQSAIDGLNKANMWANLSAAWCVLNYGTATDLSGPEVNAPSFTIPVDVVRYGLADSALTITLSPLTPTFSIQNITPATHTVIIPHMEHEVVNFQVDLLPNLQFKEHVDFVLAIDNGTFVRYDTLRKTYYDGVRISATDNDLSTLSGWTGDWAATTEDYITAPNSITDSPSGDYSPNALVAIQTADAITLPSTAIKPSMRFFARWHTEDRYDWVEVNAIENGERTPLCGLYTTPGDPQTQGGTFPLYDGWQPYWVEECMDLSAYIGKTIDIEFALNTDNAADFDGFYFDDLAITFMDTSLTQVVTLPIEKFKVIAAQPNPANRSTTIGWASENGGQHPDKILIFNTLGILIAQQKIQPNDKNNIVLDTQNWTNGVYYYQLETTDGRSITQKLIVAH